MTSASTTAGRIDPRKAARFTRPAAMASVTLAGLLTGVKIWAWLLSGSVAMLASLADSALDLCASLFTLWAVTEAATPPDAHHRFGHGKAESFAAMMQAMLVGASSALIFWQAVQRFAAPQRVEHGLIAIAVIIASIILTLALIAIQTRAVRKTASVAVAGDRSHYVADMASNLAVLIGIGAAAGLGWEMADPVMGLVIAAGLVWGAVQIGREAFDQLMDRELPEGDRARIRALAEAGDDVSIHRLRTRAAGPIIHIQFHLDVPADISLIEAHR